jgi:uncharacterized protein (TIGR03435 family)
MPALAAAATLALAIPLALGVFSVSSIRAQSPSTPPANSNGPTFEVASVKPAPPPGPGGMSVSINGGPGTTDPGRIAYEKVSALELIKIAYGMMGPGYQPEHKNDEIRGPTWLGTTRFSVAANVPIAATRDDFRLMMQNLLAERFRLSLHRETKEVAGYASRAAKNGVKMKPSPDEAPEAVTGGLLRDHKFDTDKDGFRVFPPGGSGITSYVRDGITLLTASKVTMARWADMLGNMLACPVVDQSGLTGKFDFHPAFTRSSVAGLGRGGATQPPRDSATDSNGPDLIAAVQSQLGLQLMPRKIPWYTLVIDRVEKPSEN